MEKSINNHRKTSLWAGIFYILTFISIPTFSLYQDIQKPGFIHSQNPDSPIIAGGLLEIIVGLGGIATAVILYPVLKKYNSTAALGLVAARVLEAATIFLGVSFLLSVLTLRKSGLGFEGEASAQTLVALYNRIFTLGQGFIPAIDDLLLGYLLYKSKLVPRGLALLGMIGAFPLIAEYLAILFGLTDRFSAWTALSAVPVATFEFSLGLYLIIKGFKKGATEINNN